MDDITRLNALKYRICDLIYKSGEGHLLSSLSSLDAIYVVFKYILRPSVSAGGYPFKDKFILSKGHASLALYVVLEELGLINRVNLDSFGARDSSFGGHPDATKIKLAIASTGSLGHGFPISAGIAYSEFLNKSDGQVYCMIGDGESMEGTIWETLNLINSLNISNITLLIDYNFSHKMSASISQIKNTFESFGWHTSEVDGHNIEIISKLMVLKNSHPNLIILKTIRGNGISFIENKAEWHHKVPSEADLKKIKNELLI
jgi:transketolase